MGAAELLRRGVSDHARALAGWCVGIVAYLALVSAIFPSIEGSADFDELVESYPDVLKELFGLDGTDISTGAGFLDAELFSFMLPLLVIVLAIGSGARTLAGEEDAGRLELLLAYPVRRRDAVLWKGAAVAAEVLAACVAGFVALAVLDPLIGLGLSTGRLAAAFAGVAALGLLHGWLAIGVGAAVPSRVLAIGLPAGLAAAGYLVGGLHELAGWLDPLRFASSFWWVGSSPLQGGIRWAGVAIVVAAGAAALLAGALLVERRDLETP
jgi:ABC-2 type transport system permease protein